MAVATIVENICWRAVINRGCGSGEPNGNDVVTVD